MDLLAVSRFLNWRSGGDPRFTLSADTGLQTLNRGYPSLFHRLNDALFLALKGQYHHCLDAATDEIIAAYTQDEAEREFLRHRRDNVLWAHKDLNFRTEF